MSFTINRDTPIVSSYDATTTEDATAQQLAEKLLAAGGELRKLEREGLGLDFDRQPDFKEQLMSALDRMISTFKKDHHISGELGSADESAILSQFITNGRDAVRDNPSLSSDLKQWLSVAISGAKDKEAKPPALMNSPSAYNIMNTSVEFSKTPPAQLSAEDQKLQDAIERFRKKQKIYDSISKKLSGTDYVWPPSPGKDVTYVTFPISKEEHDFLNNSKDLIPGFNPYTNYKTTPPSFVLEVTLKELKEQKTAALKAARVAGDVSEIAALKRQAGQFADSVSESDGQNVRGVYEVELAFAQQKRNEIYGKIQDNIAYQKALNDYRSNISEALKGAKDSKGTDTLTIKAVDAKTAEILTKHGHTVQTTATKNECEVLSEKLSNEVNEISNKSQLDTTELQDAISNYNNIVEAISKLTQKMYDTAKDFLR